MMQDLEKELKLIADEVRRLIIEVAYRSKSAHVGTSLSCVDLMVSLYFHELYIDKRDWRNRDMFVLSKAHAAMALYAVLTVKGLIDRETFLNYMQDGGTLPAHLDRFTAEGIEVSAGSLGHGFNMALGMAHGYKIRQDKRKVFTLIGDGESEEGSIWEGALFAAKLGIDNFTALLDYNNLQGYDRPNDICYYEPIEDKWRAFGWEVCRINGHSFPDILDALKRPNNGRPKIIVADTIKGKGVSFMEDELKWHYFIVTKDYKEKAMQDLCKDKDEEYGCQ